jgi:hypothetical protein
VLLTACHWHGGAVTITWLKLVPDDGMLADCGLIDVGNALDTVFETDAELFPGDGSGVNEETLTMFVAVEPSTAVAQLTEALMLSVAVPPDASEPIVLTALSLEQPTLPPKQFVATSPLGKLSVIRTLYAVSGPLLVTVTLYCTFPDMAPVGVTV